MTDAHDIAGNIKSKARELGFDDCRICSATPPEAREREAFQRWLDTGMNGTMSWFERSKDARADITTRYPWAKSIVVVRKDYAASRPELPTASIGERTARYALAHDYHESLRAPLQALQDAVLALAPTSEAKALWYVDTGPLLEHSYSQRSGIGWTGKHTLSLHQEHGSYFFLAEVVTSLELPPDTPATNHCGTCTRCIDACPTRAIIEPYVIDARRCISYLTIEHKGSIAPELRDQLSGYIFGCDICQEVCPWNVKREERDGPRPPAESQRAPNIEALILDDVLKLPDDKLDSLLDGTPLARTGAVRLKRNTLLVAGAEKDTTCFEGVAMCIEHDEALVREAAAWALGGYGGTERAIEARSSMASMMREAPRRSRSCAASS